MRLELNEQIVLKNILHNYLDLDNSAEFSFETNLFTKEPIPLYIDLMISDIQLLAEANNENSPKMLPTIEKQSMVFSPYPYLNVKKSVPFSHSW